MEIKNYDFRNNQQFDENILNHLDQLKESVDIRGQVLLWDSTVSSMNINIEHLADSTFSNVVIKAVLKDSAKLNIAGNIHIFQNANNCDAYFEVRVLILGNKARANVLPELKIDNKNVKAKHAVVIKRISEDDLYFLESRGIALEKAKEQIAEGFLNI